MILFCLSALIVSCRPSGGQAGGFSLLSFFFFFSFGDSVETEMGIGVLMSGMGGASPAISMMV